MQPDPNPCRLYVGTSGYSYAEWKDAGFYPADAKSANMLSIYARSFPITELNYTWYQMPRAEAIERQRQKVPPPFLFAAKLTRVLTHEIEPERWSEQADQYCKGVRPFIESGQLAAILIQLPPYFTRTLSNRRHLAALLDKLQGLPLAVEFRHRSWAADRVFNELERRGITLVNVDTPALPHLFPSLDVVTNPQLLYIRFHGRNVSGWRSGNMQKKFDYYYAEEELQTWIVDKIVPMSAQARKGVIFFNNHVRAQATENALQMIKLLENSGFASS